MEPVPFEAWEQRHGQPLKYRFEGRWVEGLYVRDADDRVGPAAGFRFRPVLVDGARVMVRMCGPCARAFDHERDHIALGKVKEASAGAGS